jgi:hypothetical protein
VKDHVEQSFNHFRRGKSHTSPDHERDVASLQGKYLEARAHVYKPGRHLHAEHKIKDILAFGCNPETLSSMIKRWADNRVGQKSILENFDTVESVLGGLSANSS